MFIRRYGETDFITGLRAIAAILVVAIHTQALSEFGFVGINISDNGRYGVQIFFVISGFTIAETYSKSNSFASYFTRRYFRIAPLYYLVCSAMFALIALSVLEVPYWMERYGGEPDFNDAFMRF